MKEIYDVLIEQNTYVFSGVQKVAEFIQKKYDYTLSIDESWTITLRQMCRK